MVKDCKYTSLHPLYRTGFSGNYRIVDSMIDFKLRTTVGRGPVMMAVGMYIAGWKHVMTSRYPLKILQLFFQLTHEDVSHVHTHVRFLPCS